MATEVGTRGKIVQVLGAVVDVEFPPDHLPEIYHEIRTRIAGAEKDLILEVEQHLGNNWVRCVAMGSTDGLQRGLDVFDMGHPISVPVGAIPFTGQPLAWKIRRPTSRSSRLVSKLSTLSVPL